MSSDDNTSQPPPPMEPTARIGSSDAASVLATSSLPLEKPVALPALPAAAVVEEVRGLEPEEIRARKRPRTIVIVWLFELVCAFFIATPVQAWASHDWGAHPDGDAVLFKPGGHDLISWLGADGPGFTIVVRSSFMALILFGVIGNIVTGALVASLATGVGKQARALPMVRLLSAGLSAFFPLVLFGILIAAVEGFVFGVGYFASSSLDHALEHSLGDARSFTVRLIVLSVFVVLTLMAGVIGDLGRVVIARNSALGIGAELSTLRRMRAGIVGSIRTSKQFVGRATIAWGWRAAIAIALIYVGSIAGDIVGGRGGGALWILFVVHQLIIFTRAALRASWLANALRLTRTASTST